MNFLILRTLTHSELGMFHAYRRSGREGSRQRAINFDSAVVDRVFPAATDAERIDIALRHDTDAGPVQTEYFLKRQSKNWRMEGHCPEDELYAFVEPGCLFAMQVNSGTSPAVGSWVVFPKDDPVAQKVLADGATSGLARVGMIALQSDEAARILRLLDDARSDMFTAPQSQQAAILEPAAATQPAGARARTGRKLEPRPARLANLLGSAGHNFVSAVADIVDNSINAHATEINITFDPPNSGNGRWLVIRDNGDGMSPEQLDEAMRVGSDPEYEARSLGKYGYGLKGASWSQARAFTVVTRQQGQPPIHLGWDKTSMADWIVIEDPLEPWEEAATRLGPKGTAVLWKHMKAPTTAPSARGVSPHIGEIQELDRHLGLVFHRFIEGDARGRARLLIRINGIAVTPNGPASHPLAEAYDAKSIKVPVENGQAEVRVQPYVLPNNSELEAFHEAEGPEAVKEAKLRLSYWGRRNENQGLYLYRNDRLIKWGGWHDIWTTSDEKTKLARVVVDFDPALDESFEVDIGKRSVRLPGFLQKEIKTAADPARKTSKKKYYSDKAEPPKTGRPSSPPPPPPGPPPVTAGPAGTPPSPDARPTPVEPPAGPPITIHSLSTRKFAWRIAGSLTGGRSLQVGQLSPALTALAQAIGNDPVKAALLAAFLEELDAQDLQQPLIEAARNS